MQALDRFHILEGVLWQRKVLSASNADSTRTRLTSRIGPELFDRITSLHEELSNHPNREEIFSYLIQREDIV